MREILEILKAHITINERQVFIEHKKSGSVIGTASHFYIKFGSTENYLTVFMYSINSSTLFE
mgnify:CR=1 FL=1